MKENIHTYKYGKKHEKQQKQKNSEHCYINRTNNSLISTYGVLPMRNKKYI